MRYRFTALAILVACGCMSGLAQQDVDITIYERPATDSIVDFGITFVETPTRRFISIKNNRTDTAVVLTNDTPFIEFSNLPWIPSGDERYKNFVADNAFPIVVPPSQIALIDLRYLALVEPSIPLDSAVEAQVRVRVARSSKPTGPSVAERTFRLRGRRTKQALLTETPVLRFDSVYVNGLRQESFIVRNVRSESVEIERQKLEMKSTYVKGEPEILVDTQRAVVVGDDGANWNIEYRPRNIGRDSAVFTIQYKLDPTSGPVTLDTRISGVGVEQRLRIVEARSEQAAFGLRVSESGDTVDFGTVGSAQDTVRAMIIVRNVGNLDPIIFSEQRRLLSGGTSSDTLSFKIEQPLNNGNPFLARDALDTLIVTYAPTAAGESSMRYAITTNIRSRATIRAVPFGADVMSFVLIGRQRRARVVVEPREVVFDTVPYSPTCVTTVRDSMRITNTGDLELRVSAIRARSGSLALAASPQTLSIAPHQSAIVRFEYRPTSEGPTVDTIDIVSNAHDQRVFGVPFRAVAQRVRDTMVLQVADTITSRPGFENVVVDVHVPPGLIRSFERCTLSIDIDTTVLRFERAVSMLTATEVAGTPERLSDNQHSVRLVWTAPDRFADRQVLTRLVFSARLGDRLDSPILLSASSSTFGTATCPDLVPVRAESGVFRIDSLCGLSYKTAMLRNQAMAGVFPNPVIDHGRLTVIAPQREHVRAVCIDAFGREVVRIVDRELDSGTHVFDVDAQALPPATYTIVVWSGLRYLSVPFVVGR